MNVKHVTIRVKDDMLDKWDKMILEDFIRYYNVLACPTRGVPRLTLSGKKSKKGLKIRAKRKDKVRRKKT